MKGGVRDSRSDDNRHPCMNVAMCDGCMEVAWASFWEIKPCVFPCKVATAGDERYMGFVLEDSLGTKPCVFPCKVALAGDERYLGCAAVADRSFWCVIGSSSVFCNEWCVVCT